MTEKLFRTEAEFSKAVIKLAHDYGWTVSRFHRLPVPRDGKMQWRTPVGADGKGFPDLTLVRERLIFAELKLAPGKPNVDQQRWLDKLASAGCEAYCWTDRILDQIEETLHAAITPTQLARMTLACDGDIDQARAIALMKKTA
jgi:hypothetical protein